MNIPIFIIPVSSYTSDNFISLFRLVFVICEQLWQLSFVNNLKLLTLYNVIEHAFLRICREISRHGGAPRVILSGNLAPCVQYEINLAAVVPLQIR